MDECLDQSVSSIGLKVRTANKLEELGLFTVRDVLGCSRETLLSTSGIAQGTLKEILTCLEKVGFYTENRWQTLGMDNAQRETAPPTPDTRTAARG